MNNPIAQQQNSNRVAAFARRSAAVGLLVWFLLLLTTTSDSDETELVHKVVFYALLVIVPLALSLVPAGDNRGSFGLYRFAVLGQPIAAVVTIASYFVAKGFLSASLSVAWLLLTGLIALLALTRLFARRFYPLEELSVDAGMLYLPVAGLWQVVYRLGVQPFDYGEMIILLTVVHFHFAGFAAPIIAGMAGRLLATRSYPSRIFPVIVFALVAAMPLIAAGITFSPWLGFIGTVLLTTGLMLLALLTLARVWPVVVSPGARLLFVIAALSSGTAMVLACLYAYSVVAKILIIRIPTMAMTHGVLNAFGFVTCSLIAWSIVTARTSSPSRQN